MLSSSPRSVIMWLFLIVLLLLLFPVDGFVLPARSSFLKTSCSATVERAIFGEDTQYYTSNIPEPLSTSYVSGKQRITLTRYMNNIVKEKPELVPLESLLLSVQMACKTISSLVHRAGLAYDLPRNNNDDDDDDNNPRLDSMKRLDQLSTNVLRNALRFSGKVSMVATPEADVSTEQPAEHQPGVLIASATDSNYVACLDPLDGSGNADASICTGTVFGVFETLEAEGVLQPGRNMRAAGYCLYSSATVLVFTLGEKVVGFTLDPQTNEFVLTHPDMKIPKKGSVYSCNEANAEGWSPALLDYMKELKRKGRYAHRYVGSMVGDVHRTLVYGGLFFYPADTMRHPRGNLQLLYKTAPMAFVLSKAGGRAIDGETGDILSITPQRVHQKSPCFMGSPHDIDQLEKHLNNNNNNNK